MPTRRLLLSATAALALALPAAATAQPAAAPRVLLSTSAGDITLELDAARAPKTVANFLAYVRARHYDGTIFHRVIPNFMIQGGGYDVDLKQKPTRAPVANEAANGLKNLRGAIAMARASDPHSATSQFFINGVDNAFLDHPGRDGYGYTVFGRVVDGMDVVDRIGALPTVAKGAFPNLPAQAVTIRSARVLAAATDSPSPSDPEKK